MLQKLINQYCRFLSFLMVVALALMVVLVFGNVVLRYAFNSGITVSEELSRWLFVWLTFLGAIVALQGARPPGHRHAGRRACRRAGKKVCLGIGQVLMLYICLAARSRAGWRRSRSTGTSTAPVMEVSMADLLRLRRGVCRARRAVILLQRAVAPADRPAERRRTGHGRRNPKTCRTATPSHCPEPARRLDHDHRHLPGLAARRHGAGHARSPSRCCCAAWR